MASGGLYSLIYITIQSLLIIFVHWTQLSEYWTHDTDYIMWSFNLHTHLTHIQDVHTIAVHWYNIIMHAPSGDWSTKIERVVLSDHCSTSKPPQLDSQNKFAFWIKVCFWTNMIRTMEKKIKHWKAGKFENQWQF